MFLSTVFTDTCLKDGSNLPQSLEQTVETAADEKPKKDSMSPFGELYQMVKQDLAAKSPWKSGLAKTPVARPQVDQVPTSIVKNNPKPVTTPSTTRRRSSKGNFEDQTGVDVPQSSTNATPEGELADMPSVESSTPLVLEKSRTPVSQKKATPSKTPEMFSAGEVVQQNLLEPQPEEKTPRSPKRRRSGVSQDQSLALQISSSQPQTPGPEEKNTDVKMSPRTSPRANAGKRFQVQDVLSEITADTQNTHTDVAIRQSKKKRVSFGGQLSPELFDKCMPPNSPLHRGATPRQSLGPSQKPLSLLRRASTIGLLVKNISNLKYFVVTLVQHFNVVNPNMSCFFRLSDLRKLIRRVQRLKVVLQRKRHLNVQCLPQRLHRLQRGHRGQKLHHKNLRSLLLVQPRPHPPPLLHPKLPPLLGDLRHHQLR